MDRFIGHRAEEEKEDYNSLKSNMDRFIGLASYKV